MIRVSGWIPKYLDLQGIVDAQQRVTRITHLLLLLTPDYTTSPPQRGSSVPSSLPARPQPYNLYNSYNDRHSCADLEIKDK